MSKVRFAAVVAATAAVIASMIVGPTTARADAPAFTVLDNSAKQTLELQVLADFVPFAESFWRQSDIPVPNTGRYLGTGSGVSQPRGAGDIAFAYATLLTAEPNQASFGGVSRQTLLDHTVKSIRYEAYTNVLSGSGFGNWGGNTWQASLETYGWADAAHLLWNQLDSDTQAIVRTVLTGEANILITKPIATATPGNTGAEDNGWNSPTPALAAVMFPDDQNRSAWEQTAIKLALNASSTAADATSDTVVDGKPLSSWMASVNLNDDMTMENHGFFNPIYQQVTHTNIDDAAIFYAQAGHALPEAFSFRTQRIWDNILGRLIDDNGDIIMPAGQDWVSKDYQHLEYLSVLATRFHDADASVLESRALQTVAARQATHDNGSILDQPDLGYESMLVKRMAASWWNHHLFGPSPVPTQQQYETARAATSGVTQFPSIDVIAARLPGASASMSWDTESPMGLWVPREEQHLDDPLFTYYAKGSLIGSASGAVTAHNCTCDADRFSTAGVIGGRDFSMSVFPDGTALLLDRGTGSTFTYSLERIPGLTGDRTIYSAGGSGLGSLPGNWVDAADRMGMVVLGGSGITAANVNGTNDTTTITGSAGTGSGNRGAALFPDVSHQATASLAAHVTQPDVPAGWSSLTAQAPDGTDRLAVARWSGASSTSLTVSDDRGAPVPIEAAQLSGHAAAFSASLGSPASEGETIRYFVDTDGPLLAHQDGENRALLTNTGTAPVHARVTYVGRGATLTGTRVIAPGETLTARTIEGQLILAGPEYEHLLAARSTLTGLRSSIAKWRAEGMISPTDAGRLDGVASAAIDQINTALTEATATDPPTADIAATMAAASHTVAQLTPGDSMPADVRAAIDTARADAGGELAQAAAAVSVVLDVRAIGTALPGEPVTVRLTAFNRGQAAATAGTITLDAPAGWTLPKQAPAFDSLPPGEFARVDVNGVVGPDASGTARLTTTLHYTAADQSHTSTGSTDVAVQPLYTITPQSATLPLASGGWNRATLTVANNAPHPIDVDLTAQPPAGVTATLDQSHISVPAGGRTAVDVDLEQSGQTSGTGELTLSGATSNGVAASGAVQLRYTDDLAWNPSNASFPAAFASSNQGPYPASFATDGNISTFWVSGGPATAGSGPTPQHPETLGVDFGAPISVGSVTMIPRSGYGPRAYTIQVSSDNQTWTPVAQVPAAANGVVKTSFSPVTTRYLRLLITNSWDGTDRNVQVSELQPTAP
ncbi:MAG TPA: discoidin domain-containing protein [Jatrophihabitans sp.]|jgi:hypothetical protein|nr:discoidin domain-containing protein [Jatrophihabitans sp.]